MPPTGRLGWPLAAALTFLAAASVLILEIAAGRLLAPYVGVSLTTYTGIIGAILAGIALGAWLGGQAAEALDVPAVEARIATWMESSPTGIIADPAAVAGFIGEARVLTDDDAPVDQWLGR